MRSNILLLQEHDIDEQQLIEALLLSNCKATISRLPSIDDIDELLSNEQIDFFILKASNETLKNFARKLLDLHKRYPFPVLYIMEEEDLTTHLELKDLAAIDIVYGEHNIHNLSVLVAMIVSKTQYKKQLITMGGYIKEATVVCEKDDDGDFIFVHINQVFLDMEGAHAEAVINKKIKNSHFAFGIQNLIEDMDEVYSTLAPVHMPNYFYIKEGKREWCDIYIYSPNPGQVSVVSASQSEVKRAHDKATESNRYLQTILNAQHHIIYITDGEKLISTNQSFLNFFECDTMYAFIKAHSKVCNVFEAANESSYINTNEPLWHRKVAQNKENRYKVRIKSHENIKIFVPSVEIIFIDNKEQYVVILTDISELESEKEKLRVLAMTDSLTGTSNRLRFNTMIDKFVELSKRYDSPLSVLMFDIDHFKRVNDQFSHEVGDTVLKELVNIVTKEIRKADLLVRWGGEEFLVLLSSTSLENAVLAAEKYRKSVAEADFTIAGKVTCSFGAATMHKEDTISDLISRADEALYQSKNAGRNCVSAIERK